MNPPFELQEIHLSRLVPGGRVASHVHTDQQLYCVLSGKVDYAIENERFTLAGGSLILIPPGKRRSLTVVEAGESLVAIFRGPHLGWEKRIFCGKLQEKRVLAETLAKAWMEKEPRELLVLRFNVLLLELLPSQQRELLRNRTAELTGNEPPGLRHVRYTETLMRDNLEHPLDLETLARLAGVSRPVLTRLFSRLAGVPVIARYRAIRLERAKELLLHGESISEAALHTGFATTQHFATAFRKYFLLHPSKIRK